MRVLVCLFAGLDTVTLASFSHNSEAYLKSKTDFLKFLLSFNVFQSLGSHLWIKYRQCIDNFYRFYRTLLLYAMVVLVSLTLYVVMEQ